MNGTVLHEGDVIAIDGATAPSPPTTSRSSRPAMSEHFETVLGWADELRTLGVRANADTPEDARRARRVRRRGHRAVPHGAHVHGGGPPAEDADDDPGRGRGGPARGARRAAAAPAGRLRGPVRGDGRSPGHDPAARPAAARVPARPVRAPRAARARPDRQRTDPPSSSASSNGCGRCRRRTRCSARAACRLGLLYPEIYEMQVRAMRARARRVERTGRRRTSRS